MAGLVRSMKLQIFPTPSQQQHPPITHTTMPEGGDNPGSNYHNWGNAPRYEDAVNPNNARRMPQTAPELTPYLGARSRLSQVWFNRWTILLLLILVRVILAAISLDGDLESARDKAFSACTGVESMGTAMASMPFYMASGVNEMSAKSIESAVRALQTTLLLMITGVQEIVVFIINLITSTYLCLITFAIRGSVGIAVDALKEITDFVNDAMEDIFNGAEKEIKSIEDAINGVTKFLEGIPGFFGGDVDIPDINIPSLDKLKDGLTIPDDFKKKLEDLEDSIPTFKKVKETANDAIRTPFQLITKQVNNTLGIYEFDRSVFPIPQKEKMTFCTDNPTINNFFDNLKGAVFKIKNALIGVICALALIAMIPMGWRELRAYRTTRRHAYMLTDPSRDFDPVDVVYIATRPHSQIFGLKVAKLFKSSRRQVLVRWAISYVTSPPALFVLALGLAGIFGVICQYILLRQIESRAPGLAAEVGEFANMVVQKLEWTSKQWAVQSNEALNSTNAELNKELFGWVKQGTDSLNDTLNTFVDTMYDGVDQFLGGTPLSGAVKDILDCLVTFKIEGIQKALTWAHDNAHFSFPTMPEDVFSRGALDSLGEDSAPSSSFLSDPESATSDQITEVVFKLIQKWREMIIQEAIISAAIVGIWFLIVIIALVRTLVLWFGRDLNRGEGGGVVCNNSSSNAFRNGPAAPVVFPAFGPSPNTPYGPPSPDEYPNEKFQIGTVNTGRMNTMEAGNRASYHPNVYDKC